MIRERSSDYKVMTMRNKEEAVVVFSGGQDSTTCLLWALSRYKKVYAISFDYGQRHVAELDCAKEIARTKGGADVMRYRPIRRNSEFGRVYKQPKYNPKH